MDVVGAAYNEQRFSPLKQINVHNVKHLGLAWYASLAERGGSYETTPIVVDGFIYLTAPWSTVCAFNAKTGKLLWKYNPKVPGQWAARSGLNEPSGPQPILSSMTSYCTDGQSCVARAHNSRVASTTVLGPCESR